MYEGVFFDLIKINETILASKLKIEESKLKRYLSLIHQLNLGKYQAAHTGMSVQFIHPRIASHEVKLSKEIYEDRLESKFSMYDKFQSYLDTTSCRQEFIEAHFGFKSDKRCQLCDQCLSNLEIKQVDTKYIQRKLLMQLKLKPLSLNELLTDYPTDQHQTLKMTLNNMVAEGLITFDGQKISIVG